MIGGVPNLYEIEKPVVCPTSWSYSDSVQRTPFNSRSLSSTSTEPYSRTRSASNLMHGFPSISQSLTSA